MKQNSKKSLKKGAYSAFVVGAMLTVPFVTGIVNEADAIDTTEGGVTKDGSFAFAGGSGTVADPYQIETLEQLRLVAQNYTSHFKLIADIDMGYNVWTPIGNNTLAFKGTFDGNGHTISNLSVVSTDGYAGLFGKVQNGYVHDLIINNASITSSGNYAGVLGGHFSDTTVKDITIKGDVEVTGLSKAAYVGGAIGHFDGKANTNYYPQSIGKVYVEGFVSSDTGKYVGGVIGNISGASAGEISSKANVISNGDDIGGLFGRMSSVTLDDVISYGDVTGKSNVGGIAGEMSSSVSKSIFAYGYVQGKSASSANLGGLFGSTSGGETHYAFAYNRSIENGAPATSGKAFGTLSSTTKYTFIMVYNDIQGTSHSTGVTGTMTKADLVSMAKYKRSGIKFDNVWGIIDGKSVPYLIFAPFNSSYDPETGEWIHTPIDKNEIYLEDAEAAVKRAESTKSIADVNIAQQLVNKLSEGADRDGLQGRLDAVMDYINALRAVEAAEYYRTQAKVNEAQVLVDKVKNETDRKYLQDRLDAVLLAIQEQANLLAEATKAVERAEATFATGDMKQTQIDKDAAQILVNKLWDGADKTALQDRLNALQQKIDEIIAEEEAQQAIVDAEAAVAKAEKSKLQADVDAARLIVNKLPKGEAKTDFTKRLDAVQAYINALAKATAAVEQAEQYRTQEFVDSAQTLVTALVDDENKQALQDRLDAIKKIVEEEKEENDLYLELKKKINAIRTGVIDGSIPVTQYDEKRVVLEGYRTEVNTLKNAVKKQELNDLIDATLALMIKNEEDYNKVESNYLEALAAVEKAEKTIAKADIDIAQKLIDSIPDTDSRKAELQKRLDAVKALYSLYDAAEKAVKMAETTPSLTNINNAQPKIDALPDGDKKDSLQERLDAVLAGMIADATTKVEKAESTLKETDISIAQTAVNKLPVGKIRDELQARLDAIKGKVEENNLYAEALAAVEKAEAAPSVSAIDIAQGKINKLTNGEPKSELQARLDAVLAGMIADATAKVEKAESSFAKTDIDSAQTAINKLPVGDVRDALQARLDAVKKQNDLNALYEAALKAVITAENTTNATNIQNAQSKINAMPETDSRKSELQARLDAALANLINEATKAVVKAEGSKSQTDVDLAREIVNKLPAGDVKTDLTNRLNAIQQEIKDQTEMDDLYDKALAAVQKAEANTTILNVMDADALVKKVKDKDPRKADLVQRVEALYEILAIQEATAAVEKAEQHYITKPSTLTNAQNKVSALKNSPAKDALQARIDAIYQAIDDENYRKAKEKVEEAESPTNIKSAEKLKKAIEAAQPLVDKLLESERKKDLQERLEALKVKLDELVNKNGKFEPGEDIIETANTVKDPDARQFLVNWATAIVNDENAFSKSNTNTVVAKKSLVPPSVLNNPLYKTLVDELTARTDVLVGVIDNYSFMHYTLAKTALQDVRAFEVKRTQENKDKAIASINILKTKENNNAGVANKLIERVNRIEVE